MRKDLQQAVRFVNHQPVRSRKMLRLIKLAAGDQSLAQTAYLDARKAIVRTLHRTRLRCYRHRADATCRTDRVARRIFPTIRQKNKKESGYRPAEIEASYDPFAAVGPASSQPRVHRQWPEYDRLAGCYCWVRRESRHPRSTYHHVRSLLWPRFARIRRRYRYVSISRRQRRQ